MSRKTIIWRVVLGIVIVAALAAAGYGIYQWGYRDGAVATCMEEGAFPRQFHRGFFWGEDEHWGMHKPYRGYREFMPHEGDDLTMPFHRGGFYGRDGYPLSRTYFSPFSWVFRIIVFGLLIWLVYTVITVFARGKGWQLSFRSIEDGDEKKKK